MSTIKTLEAKDPEGKLVGVVTIPRRDYHAVGHPVTWSCASGDGEGDAESTAQAIQLLIAHVEDSDHSF